MEDENRLLKERLDEVGVSYAEIVSGDAEGVVELYDPDQGARIKKFDVTDKIASCQTAHCGRRKPYFDFGVITSPIVPYRNLPQAPDGMTADCCSLV